MTEFPHPDLIPDKFRHELKPYGDGHVLTISIGDGQPSVDLYVGAEDWQETRLERMIKPVIAALEAKFNQP